MNVLQNSVLSLLSVVDSSRYLSVITNKESIDTCKILEEMLVGTEVSKTEPKPLPVDHQYKPLRYLCQMTPSFIATKKVTNIIKHQHVNLSLNENNNNDKVVIKRKKKKPFFNLAYQHITRRRKKAINEARELLNDLEEYNDTNNMITLTSTVCQSETNSTIIAYEKNSTICPSLKNSTIYPSVRNSTVCHSVVDYAFTNTSINNSLICRSVSKSSIKKNEIKNIGNVENNSLIDIGTIGPNHLLDDEISLLFQLELPNYKLILTTINVLYDMVAHLCDFNNKKIKTK